MDGLYDHDSRTIFLDRALGQAGRRATVAHEVVHAERGDEHIDDEWLCGKQERVVDEIAARRLISIDRLADALAWASDEWEVAEELWVDPETVRTRINRLTEPEKDYIAARIGAKGEVA